MITGALANRAFDMAYKCFRPAAELDISASSTNQYCCHQSPHKPKMGSIEPTDIRVAFVQMHVTDNKLWNIQHAERLVRRAVAQHQPHCVVLPAYFSTRWDEQPGAGAAEQHAELLPEGETFVALRRLAEQLGVYIVGGSVPERDAKNLLYNTAVVYAPSGELVARYRKIHLFDARLDESALHVDAAERYKRLETELTKAGNELATFDMAGVRCGLGIGYDLSFGELASLYGQRGAEVLIYPTVRASTFGSADRWEVLSRARAIDNQLYVLGVAQARYAERPEPDEAAARGDSMVIDWGGRVVARTTGDGEEIECVRLDLEGLREFRRRYERRAYARTDVYETVYKEYAEL